MRLLTSLAPLAGFTDAPFRRLCHEGGADLCYTEMVSAAGLAHGSSPTRHLMEAMPGEGPLACQLFGAKEDELAFATRFASSFESAGCRRFAEINLNAGCPMTKVTCSGAGAKLAEDPEKIYRLLKAMTSETDLPVTLKTRLGPHPQRTTVFEILDAAEKAGAAALIVHARYTSQMHGGAVWLDTLAEVVRRAKIPVHGNGSVTDAKTAAAMAATGVAGLMIGRAALARPGIFRELAAREGTRRTGEAAREGTLRTGAPRRASASDAPEVMCRTGSPRRASASDAPEVMCRTEAPRCASASDAPEVMCRTGAPRRASASDAPEAVRRHLDYILSFREQLAARYPNDHVPGPDAYASVKMHVHLFRYFNGRPGAAALRARLNTVRTLDEIREIIQMP